MLWDVLKELIPLIAGQALKTASGLPAEPASPHGFSEASKAGGLKCYPAG
jgi:hypothetical protein